MGRFVLKSSILAGLMTVFTLFSGIKDLSLKDIAKPYIGEYNFFAGMQTIIVDKNTIF